MKTSEAAEPQSEIPQVRPFNQAGLLGLVVDAVLTVDWPNKGSVFSIRAGEKYPSELLITLVTYCYAAGIYGSRDVESRAQSDRIINGLCGSNRPDWKTIRRFRRVHREALRLCLAHVARQALRVRFGDWHPDPTPVDYYVSLALDRWFEPLCVPCPDRDARDRIERAVFVDDMISD